MVGGAAELKPAPARQVVERGHEPDLIAPPVVE